MPVSGAQHASVHEILQAAVHSIYRRVGSRPTSSDRTGGCFAAKRQLERAIAAELRPARIESALSVLIVVSFQISEMLAILASPSTRRP